MTKDELEKFKRKNKTNTLSDALENMEQILKKNGKMYDKFANIKGQHEELKDKMLKGIISESYNEIITNRLRDFLNELLNELTLEDVNHRNTSITGDFQPVNSSSSLENDIEILDASWSLSKLISRKTIIIVVGSHLVAEILDRRLAEQLRDKIDKLGSYSKKERAIILTDVEYMSQLEEYKGKAIIRDSPVISIGGIIANKQTLYIENNRNDDLFLIMMPTFRIVSLKTEQNFQVALHGTNSNDTKMAIDLFSQMKPHGLRDFLEKAWERRLLSD